MAKILYENLIKIISDNELMKGQDVTPREALSIYFEEKPIQKAAKTVHFYSGDYMIILDLDKNDEILSIEIM